MNRNLLFVREASSFLVNAMIKTLNENGFHVVATQPDIVEIDLIQNLPDIYIVYLEGDITSFNGTLKYLKKRIAEDGKGRFLFLIGNPLEISTAMEVIPKNMVTSTFIRPVNMKDVLARLNFLLDDGAVTSGRKRILVVDDDSVMLRTMNNWFSTKYEVYMANSGMNAISLLAQHHVDLILLDYEMPVVSGLQVFEMLRSESSTANIPVIFLTAKDDKETVMKVVAARPDKYLLKTMPPEALLKALDDFFKGK
ncbi:MAG: response regulator [Treponema sp.]|nr:response regulator [Treponema sp.]